MKIAIISDIHSNKYALETALETAAKEKVDAIYCLGDIVGYGSDAATCVDLVRSYCAGVVYGNHDQAVVDLNFTQFLPKDGQEAAHYNRKQLNDEQLTYLYELPLQLVVENCTFVHASPNTPERWIRLESVMQAQDAFSAFETDICFIGHTHIPGVIANRMGSFKVKKGGRFIVNVGSVGQPRDGNPRLSMGILDTELYDYKNLRIPYNVEGIVGEIKDAGLPHSLATRLYSGR
jgi:putative phosphoesterase